VLTSALAAVALTTITSIAGPITHPFDFIDGLEQGC